MGLHEMQAGFRIDTREENRENPAMGWYLFFWKIKEGLFWNVDCRKWKSFRWKTVRNRKCLCWALWMGDLHRKKLWSPLQLSWVRTRLLRPELWCDRRRENFEDVTFFPRQKNCPNVFCFFLDKSSCEFQPRGKQPQPQQQQLAPLQFFNQSFLYIIWWPDKIASHFAPTPTSKKEGCPEKTSPKAARSERTSNLDDHGNLTKREDSERDSNCTVATGEPYLDTSEEKETLLPSVRIAKDILLNYGMKRSHSPRKYGKPGRVTPCLVNPWTLKVGQC